MEGEGQLKQSIINRNVIVKYPTSSVNLLRKFTMFRSLITVQLSLDRSMDLLEYVLTGEENLT